MTQNNLLTKPKNANIKISYDNLISLNMSTLSVPLTPELEEKINNLVRDGRGTNKAEVARKAIEFYAKEMALQDILEAEQEVKDGKILRGDLDDLLKLV
jgi:Arc/MetJ-type ribon-helix-helix transcriptional regulator